MFKKLKSIQACAGILPVTELKMYGALGRKMVHVKHPILLNLKSTGIQQNSSKLRTELKQYLTKQLRKFVSKRLERINITLWSGKEKICPIADVSGTCHGR